MDSKLEKHSNDGPDNGCEELKNVLMDAAAHYLWVIDKKYCLQYGNRIFLDYFKKTYGVILREGENVFSIPDPGNTIEEWRPRYDRVIRNGDKFSVEVTISEPHKIIEFSLSPVYSKTDKITGVLVTGHDVTKARQQADALRYSEMKFRALIEQAAEMLFLHDMKGNIVEVNKAAIRQTGYSAKELLKLTVFDIDPDASSRLDSENIWNTLGQFQKKTLEVRHRRKDGIIYPAEVTVSKILLGKSEFILALAHDITTRKKAEEEISKREIPSAPSRNQPMMLYCCLIKMAL